MPTAYVGFLSESPKKKKKVLIGLNQSALFSFLETEVSSQKGLCCK
jgi:hypothetical protein